MSHVHSLSQAQQEVQRTRLIAARTGDAEMRKIAAMAESVLRAWHAGDRICPECGAV